MSTEMVMSAAPADLRTAAAFADKLDAETGLARATALRQHAISGSLLLGTGGLVAAACVFAWGQRGPSPEELAAALAKLPPLTVTVDGMVGLKPDASVALADGGTVALAPGGVVALDSGTTVKLDMGVLPDIAKLLKQPVEQGSDGKAIRTEVTVFHTAALGAGRDIVTGWKFVNGAAERPAQQYCYVSTPGQDSLSSIHTDLALDGVPVTRSRAVVPDFDQALKHCVWWQGKA